jgi:transcriptional regulator with XRE-family HTH domain
MSLPQFLDQKYLQWQTAQGKRKTVQEFADYLGISQSVLSHYMNGKRKKPTSDNLRALSNKLGFEIYDVLGLPRPDPDLAYISQNWDKVSEEFRQKFREQVEKQLENEESKRVHKSRRAHQGS